MAWLAHFNPYHDENGRFTSPMAGGIAKKGKIFNRYSNALETDIRKGEYVSSSGIDKKLYRRDAKLGNLGFDPSKKIYRVKIKAIDDVKVANGYEFVEKLLKSNSDDITKSEQARNTYSKLKNSRFYDKTTPYSKARAQFNDADVTNSDANQLIKYLHTEMTSEKGQKLVDSYARKGYDAIPDIEDLSYSAYTSPMMILNPDKFKIVKVRRA